MKAVFLMDAELEKHNFIFRKGVGYPCEIKDYDVIITLPDKYRTVAPREVLGLIFYLETDDGKRINKLEDDFDK